MHLRYAALSLLIHGCAPKVTYPDGSGIEGQLNREVIALRQQLAFAKEEAETCANRDTAPDPVFQELHQILSNTEASVERTGRITTVIFPADHLFGSDKVSLRTEATMTLDMVATALKLHPNYRIDVEGHTDDLGVPPAARAAHSDAFLFSAARAMTVVRALTATYELPLERFGIIGRADTQPIATNHTDAGKRKNRRIVLIISPISPSEAP